MGKYAKTAFMIAGFAGSVAFGGNHWYVDAVNGDDRWDGKAAFADVDTDLKKGPKKTLSAFTNLLSKSDTIYVAPGWYTNGVANGNFRFFSDKGGISLIATGSAANTFICGEADKDQKQNESPWGCGPNAIVPIKMLGGGNIVKGFTITGGRQVDFTSDSSWGGGAVFESGKNSDCMIDCVITNCIAVRGGGVNNLGNALRCRFVDNMAENGSHARGLHCAVNCVFENAKGYAVLNASDGSKFINCLSRGNTEGNFRTTAGIIKVYNSVLLKGGTSKPKNKACDFHDCFFDFDPNDLFADFEKIEGTNGTCRVFQLGQLLFNIDGAPKRGNPVVDAANASNYTNNFPVAFSDEKEFDFFRYARVFGTAMDIGPFERNPDTGDDNEWFVDACSGNDDNSGKRPSQAFKTLARASTNSLMKVGSVVYVAEGDYDSGVIPAVAEVDQTDCRVLVKEGIDFVARGRREKTIIIGASDSTKSGIGPNAVRCCLMQGGSLRGFTLQGGNVNANSAKMDGDQGGGIKCTSKSAHVYDCEVRNCNAVRGGGVQGATLVRCYVHDNTNNAEDVNPARSTAATDTFGCSGYNTVVGGECYSGTIWLNSTLLGKAWGANTKFANCYVAADGAAAVSVAASFTNCVCAGSFKSFTKHEGCIENRPCRFDADWRPKTHGSTLVNAGDDTLYKSLMPQSFLGYIDVDYAGGLRVLEGRIDIGAGENVCNPIGMIIKVR
jgi:hypothetical protein